MGDEASPEIDRLILETANGIRRLTSAELRLVREHIAGAGFNPIPNASAQGLSGVVWKGRTLIGRDRLPAGERHYLDHVVAGQEWPAETDLQSYYDSIRDMILNPGSRMFTSRFGTRWQVTVVGRSGEWRGLRGFPLLLVEYRIGLGHWVTAFQPREGLGILRDHRRTELRWLRHQR